MKGRIYNVFIENNDNSPTYVYVFVYDYTRLRKCGRKPKYV